MFDIIFLAKQAKQYHVDYNKKTCSVTSFPGPFEQNCVPVGAKLTSTVTVGGSLKCNVYVTAQANNTFEVSVVTASGCVPVNNVHFDESSKTQQVDIANFWDYVPGIKDPTVFNPPSFCSSSITDEIAQEYTLPNIYTMHNARQLVREVFGH